MMTSGKVNKMKRFLVVLALIAVMLGVLLYFAPQPFENFIADFSQPCEVFVYCRQTTLSATDMGNGFLVECRADNLNETLSNCVQVDGISVKIAGDEQTFTALQQQLKLKVYSVQQLDNLQILCGHSNKIAGGIYLDGQVVNIQMAFDGETITLGCPLILDSY